MSFTLARFRDVDLPEFNPIAQAGSRVTLAPRARMADGRVYDRLGDAQAQQGAGTVVYVANYYDNEPYIAETKYLTLLAEVGKAGWLYRQRLATGTYERIWARLDAVDCPQDWRFPGLISNIRLTFFVVDPTWNGYRRGNYEAAFGSMRAVVINAEYGNAGIGPVQTLTGLSGTATISGSIIAGGNAPIYGTMIKVISGGGTYSNGFEILYSSAVDYYHIKCSDTVNDSVGVTIDTLAKVVYGADYSTFSYGSNHNSEDWFRLYQGANSITVNTLSGNFSTFGVDINFHFADSWQ